MNWYPLRVNVFSATVSPVLVAVMLPVPPFALYVTVFFFFKYDRKYMGWLVSMSDGTVAVMFVPSVVAENML